MKIQQLKHYLTPEDVRVIAVTVAALLMSVTALIWVLVRFSSWLMTILVKAT